jgi:hypothetical protein
MQGCATPVLIGGGPSPTADISQRADSTFGSVTTASSWVWGLGAWGGLVSPLLNRLCKFPLIQFVGQQHAGDGIDNTCTSP